VPPRAWRPLPAWRPPRAWRLPLPERPPPEPPRPRRLLPVSPLLSLLYLLDDDLDHLDLGQTKRAAAIRPALLGLEAQDAFAARQHVAGALQRVLAAQAFIDGHRTFLSDQEWFIIKTARNIDKRCPALAA